ncbi:MAG: DUF177 domain-containing protein [Alphaproteobacteria bacterium]|nr:DUF177 domain-containing protein [Alphaproteobacteria bacterium]
MKTSYPEFSRPVNLSNLSAKGLEEHLTASTEERAALAERFDLVSLDSFNTTLILTPSSADTLLVKGTLEAKLRQRCIITLNPIDVTLSVPFSVRLIPEQSPMNQEESLQHLGIDEDFEIVTLGRVDLGELVAQQLGVSLDPYPRAPEAAWPTQKEDEQSQTKRSPWASLKKLNKNKK